MRWLRVAAQMTLRPPRVVSDAAASPPSCKPVRSLLELVAPACTLKQVSLRRWCSRCLATRQHRSMAAPMRSVPTVSSVNQTLSARNPRDKSGPRSYGHTLGWNIAVVEGRALMVEPNFHARLLHHPTGQHAQCALQRLPGDPQGSGAAGEARRNEQSIEARKRMRRLGRDIGASAPCTGAISRSWLVEFQGEAAVRGQPVTLAPRKTSGRPSACSRRPGRRQKSLTRTSAW